jgi:thymidine kinase
MGSGRKSLKDIVKENQDLKNKLEKINNTLNASFIVIDKVQTFEKNQLEIINSIVKGGK